jgi:hypothetical protein
VPLSGGAQVKEDQRNMIDKINEKALELLNRVADWVREERGQTTSEYVAVTAVAVIIATTVIYSTLKSELDSAIGAIGDEITQFITNNDAAT